MPAPCWRCGPIPAPENRGTLQARSRARSASSPLSHSRLERPLQPRSHAHHISAPKTQKLSREVHQAVFMAPDRAIAEGDGPHSLDESEALGLAESAPQAGCVKGKPGAPFVFRL